VQCVFVLRERTFWNHKAPFPLFCEAGMFESGRYQGQEAPELFEAFTKNAIM